MPIVHPDAEQLRPLQGILRSARVLNICKLEAKADPDSASILTAFHVLPHALTKLSLSTPSPLFQDIPLVEHERAANACRSFHGVRCPAPVHTNRLTKTSDNAANRR